MTTSDVMRHARRLLVLTIAWSAAICVVLIERAVLPFAAALIAYLKRPETKDAIQDALITGGRAATAAARWLAANLDLIEVAAVIGCGAGTLLQLTRRAGTAAGALLHRLNDQLAVRASMGLIQPANAIAWFSSERFSDELSADQIALLEEIHDYELERTMAEAVPF